MSEFIDEIPGVVRASDARSGVRKYALAADALPERVASDILNALPDTRQITFFDPFYPSRSDPGAYVSVRRQGVLFAYSLGNHGWSRGWQNQSRELLVEYLRICLPYHGISSEHRLSVSNVPEGSVLDVLKA